jgi:hypothetical protein
MLTRAGLGFDTILFYLSKDRASWAVVVTVSNAVKWSDSAPTPAGEGVLQPKLNRSGYSALL